MKTKSDNRKPKRQRLLPASACSVTRELKYIADSPEQKYGGFHIHAVTTARNALREIRRLRMAVRWALGEIGDFPMRQDGQGAYWWRTELRRRAGMSPNGPAHRRRTNDFMKPKPKRKTKIAIRRSVQPVVRQMWAVRWLDCDGITNPHPANKGAWMLCCTKSLAEDKRLSEKQVITRVRVAILPNAPHEPRGTETVNNQKPQR